MAFPGKSLPEMAFPKNCLPKEIIPEKIIPEKRKKADKKTYVSLLTMRLKDTRTIEKIRER